MLGTGRQTSNDHVPGVARLRNDIPPYSIHTFIV